VNTAWIDKTPIRINPNPRLVGLLNYAIEQVRQHLYDGKYRPWVEWADEWLAGRRSPQECVRISHECFSHKGAGMTGEATDPVWHALGQLAWGAKEACYSEPKSGWLVIRYIADAMVAFGIAFPDKLLLAAPQDETDRKRTGADA